jgi:hypothetical protein
LVVVSLNFIKETKMAVDRQRRKAVYGVGQPLYNIPPDVIVSASSSPGTTDKAEIGTIWVNKSTNGAWILASIVANSATWTPTTVNAGATITTGNLIVTAGYIQAVAGNIIATAGDIIATAGDFTATAGGFVASAGGLDVATTVVAGTGITATTGDITASTGDVVVSLGDVSIITGGVDAAAEVLALSIAADGDSGGAAGQTTMTNVVDTALSSGTLTIKSTSAGSGNNTGFLKFYVAGTPVFVPYFAVISP